MAPFYWEWKGIDFTADDARFLHDALQSRTLLVALGRTWRVLEVHELERSNAGAWPMCADVTLVRDEPRSGEQAVDIPQSVLSRMRWH